MKKIIFASVIGVLFSTLAQARQQVETITPNATLDGVAAECESQQDMLSAKIFFKDSNSAVGFSTAYMNTDLRPFTETERQSALLICRLLVSLAQQRRTVTLIQGFNYEGPGPVVGFRINSKEYLLPQVSQ